MKRIVLFFLVVLCMSARAAVTLPSKCTASMPQLLKKNLVKESEINALMKSSNWGQSSTTDKFWVVYSDREENTTYNGPSSSSGVYGKLQFNEKVRIAQIQGDYALVYEEKELGIDYPRISTSAVSKGWVPMKNLLLWKSCPTNEVGIYNKALIVMNLDEVRSGQKNDLGKRYKNPETRSGTTTLHSSMTFYFVMKRAENGLVLLAKECKMEGYSENVLFGWVHTNSYVPWDHRTCLEPNWQPRVAEQMVGKHVPVYKKADLSMKGCEYPMGRKNNLSDVNAAQQYRLLPQEMRFPLLMNDSRKDDLYKLTAFARPDGPGSITIVPEGNNSEGIIDEKLKEKSIINLIVVIDGTKSMEKYYPPTQKIIQDAYNYFGKENGTKVRVGVVIYRDYADGEYVTEKLTMRSPTDPSIATFLTNGGKYGIKSSPADHTSAEALYKGLEVALDASGMGYSSKNSNLMFVVGDCGNDLSDKKCISDEEIIDRCVKNHVNISAFQVRNLNEQAFLLFRQQMGKIVRENMKRQYGQLKQGGGNFSAGFKELADGYEFTTTLPSAQQFYIGSTRNASLGKEMELPKLYDIVKNSYMQFNVAIAAAKGTIIVSDELWGGDSESSAKDGKASVDLAYLKTIFTEKEIEKLRANNNLMAFQGYTKKAFDADMDYWKPVIYISSDEFAELMEHLKPVAQAVDAENRKPYVDAMKALIRLSVPDIKESEMNEMSVEEIMAIVSGLPTTSNALKHKIIDIQNESKVNAVEFEELVSSFKKKYDKLKMIREQKYPFSLERNMTRWYWIPQDDLP